MTHTTFAILSGIICGAMGVRYAASLRKNAARLKRWDELLACLAQLLSESVYSLPDAFRLAACEKTSCDALMTRLAQEMVLQPLSTPAQVFDGMKCDAAETDILRRMLERIGHGSLETRCLAVRQAGEEIRLMYQRAKSVSDKDAKMWSSLGWTAGACVTLLLL